VDLLPTAAMTDQASRASKAAVLPIGSFEQHGGHLPLVTDTVIASIIARRLAEAYGLVWLPPVTMSCSHEHEGFAGTVSITASTLIAVVEDVRASLARAGIDRLVLVNGHGGNYVLSNIVQEANVTGRYMTLFPSRHDWNIAYGHAGLETTPSEDMHGGELETSIMLLAAADLVGAGYADADHEAPDRPHLLITGMTGYTDTGIVGRPSAATNDKGRAVLHSLTASFADHYKLLVA
jgi:creatinine amidohydrolase